MTGVSDPLPPNVSVARGCVSLDVLENRVGAYPFLFCGVKSFPRRAALSVALGAFPINCEIKFNELFERPVLMFPSIIFLSLSVDFT